MDLIAFEKTGNFWIDNGIIAMYKICREIGVSAKLDENKLTITSEDNNNQNVEDILNTVKEDVVRNYLTKTNGAGWIYRNGNFEVYRKTDFKLHLKPFFTGKTPATEGKLYAPDIEGSKIGPRDRTMGNDEYKEFVRFKSEKSPVVIGETNVSLKNIGFINNPPKYEIGNPFSKEFFSEGKKLCTFSGKRYRIADVVTGMNYPFLTGKSGELNFASSISLKPSISALYDFISLFSFRNLNFLIHDDLKNYFVLYEENLREMANFYNVIFANIHSITRPEFCSFETQLAGTQYESESLLNFLLSVYSQVNLQIDKDKRKGILLKKRVYTLTNDGNIFRDVKEYSSLNGLFELMDSFGNYKDDERSYREPFLNFVRNFTKRLDSGKYDTTWRDRLCADILYFRSILKTVEWYMGDVKLKEEKGNIIFLDKIIEIYNFKTQNVMKSEMVEICKSVGNRIGAYCREKADRGILFSIRNAKSRTEFLNVLAETQFRTEVSFSETFFKELPDNSGWEEYKALVSIFAMNSFLYKEKKINEIK